MGTDVHPGFQKRVKDAEGNESWEFILDHNYDGGRHYFLFGWLANVRNGSGFAGCDTGDGIKPLAMPRGLPDGLAERDYPPESEDAGWWNTPAYEEWKKTGGSFGDHSHSWLTSTEIIEGSKNFSPVNKRGVISMAEYKAWDKKTPLESWSGGIWGKGHRTINQGEVTPQLLAGQAYADELYSEIGRSQAKNRWVTRHVKKLVSENYNPWPFTLSRHERLQEAAKPKTERIVRESVLKRKKSKLKHLAKLNRYVRRVGTVSVRVQWQLDSEAIYKEYAYFIDEVKRLHELYGEVRMVFGFDS